MVDMLEVDQIASSRGSFEPQRTNNFSITIPGDVGADPEILRLSTASFPALQVTLESKAIGYLNEERKFPAGRATFPGGNYTFKDYCDKDTARAVMAWFKKGYDPATGKIGLCANIKKQVIVAAFAPDGSIVRQWKLLGVWCNECRLDEFSMANTGEAELVLGIVWDKFVEM